MPVNGAGDGHRPRPDPPLPGAPPHARAPPPPCSCAPLLFTALNNQFFSANMNAPMPSLPVVIFQFALSPYEEWQKLAWTGALLITVTVLALSILARSLTARK